MNDHDQLRYDPALACALSQLNFIDAHEAVLAGKSTLNRLEYCPETVINQAESRKDRIEHQPKELSMCFCGYLSRIVSQSPTTNYSGYGCDG